MNFYKSKLSQIRLLLGMEVKMVEALLEDGVTKVKAEVLEPGYDLVVVSESGEEAPAPEGSHTLEDGTKVTVDAQGKITEVIYPEPAKEPAVEVEIEAAAEEEVKEEEKVTMEDLPTEVIEEIVEKKIEEMMEKVYMALEEVVKDVTEVKEEMASYKEKMSKTPGSSKISTFNTEAFSPSSEDVLDARLEHLKKLKIEFGKNKRKF